MKLKHKKLIFNLLFIVLFSVGCTGIAEDLAHKDTKNATEAIVEPNRWYNWSPEGLAKAYKEPKPIDLYDKYFGDEAPIARAICIAENGTQDPQRVSEPNWNGTIDIGLCQINSIYIDKVGGNLELLKDAETNIRIAKQIRDSWESWEAWTCYKNGAYKKHLQDI